MTRAMTAAIRGFCLVLLAVPACAQTGPAPVATVPLAYPAELRQGWSTTDRDVFYRTGQGSRLMPAKWFVALRRPGSTERFAADQLARYGYLPSTDASGLPVGFVIDPASHDLGMTCAACHTGVVSYQGRTWRIDGGRTSADFQRFLSELTAALRATVASADRLDAFAAEVAGAGATPSQKAAVAQEFTAWVPGFGHFMDQSLPDPPWGPGRLDAFGMIFNRVTALDLKIDANYRRADAPVRYPFLWNAPLQDRTQWDGAAPNGSYVKARARNTGEVLGVFGHFDPDLVIPFPAIVRYVTSVKFGDLQTLEEKITTLERPPWPREVFGLDEGRAASGALLFATNCAACHGQLPSRSVAGAWATPVCRVGTDPKMYQNALLSAASGKLAGTFQLTAGGRLADPDKKVNILANAVVGALLLDTLLPDNGIWTAINKDIVETARRLRAGGTAAGRAPTLPAECDDAPQPSTHLSVRLYHLRAAGRRERECRPGQSVTHRDREGFARRRNRDRWPLSDAADWDAGRIGQRWLGCGLRGAGAGRDLAVAPYLHNGSVPTLADLLKPVGERPKAFGVNTHEFDPKTVGLAVTPRGPGDFIVDADHGNANSGHEYGTNLPEPDRQALLEYLKTL